jgi:hypothetical protein
MNRTALARSQLTLRVIPPRAGCDYFSTPPNYDAVLSEIQRLRGSRYFADGAISAAALDAHGRHVTAEDEKCYHLVLSNGRVQGCLRLRLHPKSDEQITKYAVYDLIRRMPGELAKKYHAGLEELIRTYCDVGMVVGESGGWAISQDFQGHVAMLAVPLAGWSFSRVLSRQVWIAAATERNGSAEMLKRMGGWRLKLKGEELPSFYDPGYKCQMELLCFDSDILNPKFEPAVRDLQALLEEQRAAQSEGMGNKLVYS